MVGAILVLRINAFVALYVSALLVSLLAPGDWGDKVARVAVAFGVAAGKIGIVIALAAVIGTCMMESGAADRIVAAFTRVLGAKRGSTVLLGSGYVLSIPVFFDTVFYLLVPLARSFHRRTGQSYVQALMAIAAGGVVTHTLVPPTPGPLAAATTLGVDVGLMIAVGGLVGLVGAAAGMAGARYLAGVVSVPFRGIEGDPVTPGPGAATGISPDVDDRGAVPAVAAPPLSLAVLPVALPVLLIALRTILVEAQRHAADPGVWARAVTLTALLGDPNTALLISMLIALYLVRRQRSAGLRELESLVERSLKGAGIIILITAAGAAFGEMLKAAQLSEAMRALLGDREGAGYTLLFIAFGTAAVLKIAQGSTTAAIIVTSAIVAAMLGDAPLPYHRVYLALAIGAGGLIGSWMNDSGFWVFSRMGGLTERETLATWTPILVFVGVGSFAATLLGALLVPLR